MKTRTGNNSISTTFRGLGLILGAGLGAAIGAVLGAVANGIAFGIALGLGLGTLIDSRYNRKDLDKK